MTILRAQLKKHMLFRICICADGHLDFKIIQQTLNKLDIPDPGYKFKDNLKVLIVLMILDT